jgi:hypothetical protein
MYEYTPMSACKKRQQMPIGKISAYILVNVPSLPPSRMLKTFTWVLGVILIVIGALGFINNPVLGLFDVDTIHNIVHLLSGIVAIIAAMGGASYARLYLIVFGIVYALVAVIGFVNNGDILGLFAANRSDDYLHTAIALACLAVGFGNKK